MDTSVKNVSPKDLLKIYDPLYERLCALLLDPAHGADFSYHGVKLLGCFKKELFDDAFSFALGLKTISQREPRRDLASPMVPVFFKFGNLDKVRVAIFSDFARSQSVLKELPRGTAILFTPRPSLRTLFRAMAHGAAYAQTAFHEKEFSRYQELSAIFLKRLCKKKIFWDFLIRDVNAEEVLQREVERLFQSLLPELLFHIESVEQFFSHLPSLRSALLDEDIDPFKNAFCQVACRLGVKTFVELHGALGGKHGLVPLTADFMFVWGRAQKNRLIEWGCPAEKLIVSGSSRYSVYQKMDVRKARTKVARTLGLDPGKPILLLVFTPVSRWQVPFEAPIRRVIAETLQVAASFAREGVQFVIKLHPFDRTNLFYADWVQAQGLTKTVAVVNRFDPLLLAKAVEGLVVYGSTYAVDGFALGKPVMLLYDRDDPYRLLEEFRPFEIFHESCGPDELASWIRRLYDGSLNASQPFETARRECPNKGGPAPAAFIASTLLHVEA